MKKAFFVKPENRAAICARLEEERRANRNSQLPRWIAAAEKELASAIADNEPDWYIQSCRERLAKLKA